VMMNETKLTKETTQSTVLYRWEKRKSENDSLRQIETMNGTSYAQCKDLALFYRRS